MSDIDQYLTWSNRNLITNKNQVLQYDVSLSYFDFLLVLLSKNTYSNLILLNLFFEEWILAKINFVFF